MLLFRLCKYLSISSQCGLGIQNLVLSLELFGILVQPPPVATAQCGCPGLPRASQMTAEDCLKQCLEYAQFNSTLT